MVFVICSKKKKERSLRLERSGDPACRLKTAWMTSAKGIATTVNVSFDILMTKGGFNHTHTNTGHMLVKKLKNFH